MSVIKSQRSNSAVEFLHTARELELFTIRKVVNFPKRYTFYVSQPLAASAASVHIPSTTWACSLIISSFLTLAIHRTARVLFCPNTGLERDTMKVILDSGAVIDATSVTLEPHFTVAADNRAAFLSVWDELTDEALKSVSIYSNDKLLARFTDCELAGTQTVHSYDGSMVGHFYLTGLPAAQSDPEFEEAYKVLAGEVVA